MGTVHRERLNKSHISHHSSLRKMMASGSLVKFLKSLTSLRNSYNKPLQISLLLLSIKVLPSDHRRLTLFFLVPIRRTLSGIDPSLGLPKMSNALVILEFKVLSKSMENVRNVVTMILIRAPMMKPLSSSPPGPEKQSTMMSSLTC